MALTVVNFPESVAPAVEIAWEMDVNHGAQENPYSGKALPVRGLRERWKFSMRFKPMTRSQIQAMQGFFMELEGPLHAFRMRDHSQPTILGANTTNPTIDANASARDRVVSLAGIDAVAGALKAGDWIQFPTGQMCKVAKDVTGLGATAVPVTVWPFLWQDEAATGTVLASAGSPAYGYFRFDGGLPSWTANASNKVRPYVTQLSGSQIILSETVVYP